MLGAVGEAHLLEQLERAATALARGDARPDQRHLDVQPRAQLAQQQVLLEDEPDELTARPLVAPPRGEVDAVDQDPSFGGAVEAADQVQQGALPDPDRPVIATSSPGSTCRLHLAQRLDHAEAAAHPLDVDTGAAGMRAVPLPCSAAAGSWHLIARR